MASFSDIIPVNRSYVYDDGFSVVPVQANTTPAAFNGGLSPMQKFTGSFSQFFGGTDANGTPKSSMLGGDSGSSAAGGMTGFQKGVAGLQTVGSLWDAWNGYQQTKLAKQQLAFQKDAFNKQYAAQAGLVNSQMEDRQTRRVNEAAANQSSPVMSVSDYVAKYGVRV